MNSPDRWDMRTAVLSYAQLGQPAALERWRARLGESWPDYSAELNLATGDLPPEAAAERSLFLDSVAKAGLPICATPEQLAENPDINRLPECTKAEATK